MMSPDKEIFDQTIQKAIDAMQDYDSKNARSLLLTAMALSPDSPVPSYLLACDYAQNREYDLAEGAFISALQLQPGLAIARFQLGLLQLTNGRPAAALSTWAPLRELPESDPLRLFKTGLEQMALDQFDEAKLNLRRGLDANLENPALNRDMQMMIDAIQSHQDATAAAGQSDGIPTDVAEEDTTGTAHFLLSRYRSLQ